MYVYLLTLLSLVFIMFFLKQNYIEEFKEKKSRNQSRINTSLTIGGIIFIFLLGLASFAYNFFSKKGKVGIVDLSDWFPENRN